MSSERLPGITVRTISSDRLRSRVLFSGPDDGIPILFIHGNFSSATWWEEHMLALPTTYRAIAPDQRGFGDADPKAKVDGQKGMLDFAEDAIALMNYLGYKKFHVVGNSLGGVIVWWLLAYFSEHLLSVTLAGPGSPFGFGATKDARGTPTSDDFAGSGGGLLNLELIRGVREGDRSMDHVASPRAVLRLLVWGPPFIPEREDQLLDAMLSIHLSEYDTPGDHQVSQNWPYFSPGRWGPMNALSPAHMGDLIERIVAAEPKVKILWIYGGDDVAICDTAASDPGSWGPQGLLPGYPGVEAYPPQPMMKQIRAVLQDYADTGGDYQESVIEGSGHVPFISHPSEYNCVFHTYLSQFHSGDIDV